jgi:hypothetical protein
MRIFWCIRAGSISIGRAGRLVGMLLRLWGGGFRAGSSIGRLPIAGIRVGGIGGSLKLGGGLISVAFRIWALLASRN